MADKLTLNQVLDKAVDKLPPIRRAAVKWKLRNQDYREGVLSEVTMHATESREGKDLMPAQAMQTSGEDIGAIAIDLDKVELWINLFLKYLPTVLDLIARLFPK